MWGEGYEFIHDFFKQSGKNPVKNKHTCWRWSSYCCSCWRRCCWCCHRFCNYWTQRLVGIAMFLDFNFDISATVPRQSTLSSQTHCLVCSCFVVQQRFYFLATNTFCFQCFAFVRKKHKNCKEKYSKHFLTEMFTIRWPLQLWSRNQLAETILIQQYPNHKTCFLVCHTHSLIIFKIQFKQLIPRAFLVVNNKRQEPTWLL